MHQQGVKFVGAEFRNSEIGDDFATGDTTSDATVKWWLRLDSARRKGLEPLFHKVLTVVGDAS